MKKIRVVTLINKGMFNFDFNFHKKN